MSGINLNIP